VTKAMSDTFLTLQLKKQLKESREETSKEKEKVFRMKKLLKYTKIKELEVRFYFGVYMMY